MKRMYDYLLVGAGLYSAVPVQFDNAHVGGR